MKFALLIGWVSCLVLILGHTQPLAAQTKLEPSLKRQSQITYLEVERDNIKLAKPWTGLAVSMIAVVPGTLAVLFGTETVASNCAPPLEPDDPRCDEPRPAITATGALILAGAAAGIIASSIKLRQKYKARRRLEREIEALRAKGVSVSLGPPQPPALIRF